MVLNRWDDRDTLVSIFQKTTKLNDGELLKRHTLKLQILNGGFREVIFEKIPMEIMFTFFFFLNS